MSQLIPSQQRAPSQEDFQRNIDRIEVNLVVADLLTNDQEARLRKTLRERISRSLDFAIRQMANFTFQLQ